MMRKHNEGFTLVELMVGILIASVVTLAASTVLLLGMRLNRSSSDTAQRQNTTRIFMTVVERMATEGTIDDVSDVPDEYWKAVEKIEDAETGTEKEKILFYYDSAAGIIYSGGELKTVGGEEEYDGGTPLMENVIDSHIVMDGPLLRLSLETQDGSYSTSVYCRTANIHLAYGDADMTDAEENLKEPLQEMKGKKARAELLKILLSQRGSTGMIYSAADGKILDENGEILTLIKTPVYYAQWYEPKWSSATPWCACFLSWGLNQVSYAVADKPKENAVADTSLKNVRNNDGKYFWFANVDEFMKFFKGEIRLAGTSYEKVENPPDTYPYWVSLKDEDLTNDENKGKIPNPGDIIFIDWTRTQTDPAHVGIVLAVEGDFIYTIEGNSANMVAVRKYALTDKLIMGYGIIDWLPDPQQSD